MQKHWYFNFKSLSRKLFVIFPGSIFSFFRMSGRLLTYSSDLLRTEFLVCSFQWFLDFNLFCLDEENKTVANVKKYTLVFCSHVSGIWFVFLMRFVSLGVCHDNKSWNLLYSSHVEDWVHIVRCFLEQYIHHWLNRMAMKADLALLLSF